MPFNVFFSMKFIKKKKKKNTIGMRCMKLAISTIILGLYSEIHFHAKFSFLALIVYHAEVF